jgi:hypothetical protein
MFSLEDQNRRLELRGGLNTVVSNRKKINVSKTNILPNFLVFNAPNPNPNLDYAETMDPDPVPVPIN